MVFSIIVPIFNVECYINQCINSVLDQDFQDFELILVDDGSPDNCSSICDEYAQRDSRIKVIHKNNGGLVSARKAGVRVAVGDYVIALDGDDWLAENCLKELSIVVNENHPDVIRFGLVVADNDGNYKNKYINHFIPKYYKRKDVEDSILPYLIYGFNGLRFPHSICGACVKMELYRNEQLSVEDRIRIGEDGVVMRPVVYKAQSVYIIKDCLYYYRRNLSSMTKNRKPFPMDNYIWIAEHYNRRMDLSQYDLQGQVYRSVVHNAFTACVTQFWQDAPYTVIRQRILSFLDQDIVHHAISCAKFGFSCTNLLMLFVMKKRIIPVLWLYSKIKSF